MPSRRILSNNNLAPIQEVAVNPYNSFNSDSVNKITRIVSGGKGHDVVVDGLNVSSNDKIDWIDSGNLVSTIVEGQNNQFDPSCGWSGEGYYVGKFDGGPTVYTDLYIEHQNSYGFSWISCKLNDKWLQCYYGKDDGTGQSIERDFEVTFDLTFGTPKSIVAEINSSRAVLDHPESGRSYSLRLTRNFLRDTKQDGLIFRIGAVLDGADPLAGIIDHYDPEGHIQQTITNKTYIRISNIQVKVYGYSREPFSRSIGPANGVRGLSAIYGLAGIHPVKTLKVTPGLAIKDDVMLEELGLTRYDRDTIVELNPTQESSWIKGNPYTKNDFGTGIQYAFQLNNTNSGYTRHEAHFDSEGHLKVKISGTDYDLIDDYAVSSADRSFTFNDIGNGSDDSKFDEDNNLYLCHTGVDLVAGSICLLTYKGIVVEKKVVTQEDVNNHRFVITLRSDKVTAKLESLDDIKGYIAFGPIKVSGDPQLYNSDLVKWAYVVIYYSYFKHPVPNVSYIGLVREEDLNDVKFREDYLILAKVRFVDFETIDIISYENRQRKWLPRSDKINYSTTCNFPEIWYDEVPDTVTDAIDYLAKFDVNLARLIRYKHDYDAEISSAFNLITDHEITSGSDKDKKPYISINDYSHLERRIRVNTNKLTVTSIYNGNTTLLNKEFTKTTRSDGKIIYVNNSIDGQPWAITFEQSVIDNRKEYEYFSLGGEVLVKASMGPYDSSTGTITNRYICFNTIGPFRFLEKDTGNEAVKADWEYSDILLYPTSPSMNKSEEGKFTDVDDGGYSDGYYNKKTQSYNTKYLLSYTNSDGSTVNELNSSRNHFQYVKFRGEYLVSDKFLKLLDILPRHIINWRGIVSRLENVTNPKYLDIVGVSSDRNKEYIYSEDGKWIYYGESGSHVSNGVYESLLHKRVLEGRKDNSVSNDQCHVESSIHQLDDDMIDDNVLISQRDNQGTNHIKSSKFTIDSNLSDEQVLTSEDITETGKPERIKIKSTKIVLEPSGGNKILVSNLYKGDDVYKITSSDYTVADILGYWYKPKISYEVTDSESFVKLLMDCSKNFIIRVSEIIKYFDNNDPQESRVEITRVKKLNDNRTRYYYTNDTNSVKAGMLVYTTGSSESDVYNNTIYLSDDQFGKVKNGSFSVVSPQNESYIPINKDYATSGLSAYIMPAQDSSFYATITNIVKDGEYYKIYYGTDGHSGLTSIDDFIVKNGMVVYTKNINTDFESTGVSSDANIYRFNYLKIEEVGNGFIKIKFDEELNDRVSSIWNDSRFNINSLQNPLIYFYNTKSVCGLYPYANVTATKNGTQVTYTFNTTKYLDINSLSLGDQVFSNSGFTQSISEDNPLEIVSINTTTIGDEETVSGFTVDYGSDIPSSATYPSIIYFKTGVSGLEQDGKLSKYGAYVKSISINKTTKIATFNVVTVTDNQNEYIVRKFSNEDSTNWTNRLMSLACYFKNQFYQQELVDIEGKTPEESSYGPNDIKWKLKDTDIGIEYLNDITVATFAKNISNYENVRSEKISDKWYNYSSFTIDLSNLITDTLTNDINLFYDVDGLRYNGSTIIRQPNVYNYNGQNYKLSSDSSDKLDKSVSLLYKVLVSKVIVDEVKNITQYKTNGVFLNEPDCMIMTENDENVSFNNEISGQFPSTVQSAGISDISSDPDIDITRDKFYFEVDKNDSFDTILNYDEGSERFESVSKFVTLNEIITTANRSDPSMMKIKVDIDVADLKNKIEDPEIKDDYQKLDRYYKGRIVIVNDLDNSYDLDEEDPTKKVNYWKSKISISFAIIDKIHDSENDKWVDGELNETEVKSIDVYENPDPDVSTFINTNPSKIIWRDEYRGYNNYKDEEQEYSEMKMYPEYRQIIDDKGNINYLPLTTLFTPKGTDVSNLSGYGLCRGGMYELYAGMQGEFEFQYSKTIPKIPSIESEEYSESLGMKQIRDVIYAKASLYSIKNTDTDISDSNLINVIYNCIPFTFIDGETSRKTVIDLDGDDSQKKYSVPEIDWTNSIIKYYNYPMDWVVKKGTLNVKVADTEESNDHHNNTSYIDGGNLVSNVSHTVYCIPRPKKINVVLWNGSTIFSQYSSFAIIKQDGTLLKLLSLGTFPIPTLENKIFSFWSYSNNAADQGNHIVNQDHDASVWYDNITWIYDAATDTDGILNIYASYTTFVINVTLIDESRSISHQIIDVKTYTSSTSIYGELPRNLTREGYDFSGWRLQNSNELVKDTDILKISGDHSLFAVWKPKKINLIVDAAVFGNGDRNIYVDHNGQTTILNSSITSIELDGGTEVKVSTKKDVDKIVFIDRSINNKFYDLDNTYSYDPNPVTYDSVNDRIVYTFILNETNNRLILAKINDNGSFSYDGYAHESLSKYTDNGFLIGGFKYRIDFYNNEKFIRTYDWVSKSGIEGDMSTRYGFDSISNPYTYDPNDTQSFINIAHRGSQYQHIMHCKLIKDNFDGNDPEIINIDNPGYYMYNDSTNTNIDPDLKTNISNSSVNPQPEYVADISISEQDGDKKSIQQSLMLKKSYLSIFFDHIELDLRDKPFDYLFRLGFNIQDNSGECGGIRFNANYKLYITL